MATPEPRSLITDPPSPNFEGVVRTCEEPGGVGVMGKVLGREVCGYPKGLSLPASLLPSSLEPLGILQRSEKVATTWTPHLAPRNTI